jgi:carboxyl-terminal processing protease
MQTLLDLIRPPYGLRALLALALLATPLASAEPVALAPSSSQVKATGLITRIIDKQHYLDVALDDAFSARVFDRYLESLDPSRSYLLAEDVARLTRYREKLDDALRQARLEPAYQMFSVYRTRLAERGRHALTLLDGRFDFSRDEEFRIDRKNAPWPRDRKELDEIWRQRVKNDVLNLMLAGRTQQEAVRTLKRRYEALVRRAEQFNAEDVYQVFMNAYAGSIEPHTAYLSPRNSENFQIQLSLSLEGIGAALQSEDDYTVVQRIIPGGPASLSGQLQAQDRVTAVGQGPQGLLVDVVGWRLDDVVDLIRGPKGSTVRLEVLPKGAPDSGPRKVVTLVRERVRLEEQAAKRSVVEVFGPHGPPRRIGVINIPTFYLDAPARARGEVDYRSTTRDVARLLAELSEERVDGVVLDLRGDGGGALSEAIELTGLFIPTGPVVQVRDATGKIQVLEDTDSTVAYRGPLAVLVDRQSASASEIVAAALQDYGRAIVLGEPTFGKGTVQSLLDLSRIARGSPGELGQLKATVAQFFRVNGSSTQHRGVLPDVAFPTASDPGEDGERSLSNAIPWAQVEGARYRAASDLASLLPAVRARHQARIGVDPGFLWLMEEGAAQRAVSNRSTTSLTESRRRAEREVEQRARVERESRFRTARGLPPRKAADDDVSDASAPENPEEDVWLSEAAHVLADLVDLSQVAPHLHTASESSHDRLPACVAEPCVSAPGALR